MLGIGGRPKVWRLCLDYTLARMLRLFVAISVPPAVRQALSRVHEQLAQADDRWRWVRPDVIHLTLAFLGGTDEARVPLVEQAMRSAAGTVRPFRLEACGLGTFPPRGTPRVPWAGLGGDLDTLRRLQRELDSQLRREEFALEDRPFSPHLTLARAGDRAGGRPVAMGGLRERLGQAAAFGNWRVEALSLVKSELRRGGSIYTTLCTAPLGPPEAGRTNAPSVLRSAAGEVASDA